MGRIPYGKIKQKRGGHGKEKEKEQEEERREER